jgi:hypothetical protein
MYQTLGLDVHPRRPNDLHLTLHCIAAAVHSDVDTSLDVLHTAHILLESNT